MKTGNLQFWIGREERARDIMDLARAQRMHALLGQSADDLRAGDTLPPGYHWLYCVPVTPNAERGVDGHARVGGLITLVESARRMWAGGSLRFVQPLVLGSAIERRSVISAIEEKEGRTGRFHLVRVQHELSGPAGVSVEERQDLVYLPAHAPTTHGPSIALSEQPDWSDSFTPDEVTLFFFSALTMNGHRIHYDYRYATEVEGYPGLLVHGPLTALLLLHAAQRHGSVLNNFSYRAIAPLYCGQPITLAGKIHATGTRLWALRPDGSVAMEATAG